jgi:tetratricopeptide (TPR) repeat protein
LVLRGGVASARGDRAAARAALERAVSEFPAELEPRRAWCRFLFEHGDPAEAQPALAELARRVPEDAAVHHNLGLVALRQHHGAAAVAAFRRSLELRPDTPATLVQLGHALRLDGQPDEAIAAWRQAQQLDPHDRGAAEALRSCAEVETETAVLPV